MSLIRKKFNELDVTWKIAFKKTLLVIGCFIGCFGIYFIILIGLSIIFITLSLEDFFFFFVYLLPVIPLFGFLIGLFKALVDISILTKEDLRSS